MKRQFLKDTAHRFNINNESLPIIIKKRRGARRIVLRYQPLHHAVMLSLPKQVSIAQGLAFLEKKRGWLEGQIENRAMPVPFTDGQMVPVLGRECRICHTGGRGVVRMEENRLLVPGAPEFLSRRVRDWLKSLAKEEIVRRAQEKAGVIGKRVAKISLRDTRSRWGSCNKKGNLSFSWRLILAPEHALDYVVVHEAAHLKELNHGPRFWALVEELCPHWKESRAWLKSEGEALYRYGG